MGTYLQKWGPWLWQKEWSVPGEVTLAKKKILKELLGIFHKVESTKYKIVEADPNLEIWVWQFAVKIKDAHCIACHMSSWRKQALFTVLTYFVQRNKTTSFKGQENCNFSHCQDCFALFQLARRSYSPVLCSTKWRWLYLFSGCWGKEGLFLF